MKVTALSIARVCVSVGKELPAAELPALMDTAASLLVSHGLLKDARTFPELLRREWLKAEGAIATTLETTSGSAGKTAEEIGSLLQHALKKACVLEERADPTLLGGMVLSVGDERFDLSLRGALTELSRTLSAPVS